MSDTTRPPSRPVRTEVVMMADGQKSIAVHYITQAEWDEAEARIAELTTENAELRQELRNVQRLNYGI